MTEGNTLKTILEKHIHKFMCYKCKEIVDGLNAVYLHKQLRYLEPYHYYCERCITKARSL